MEVLSAQRPSLTVWHQLKSTMDTWVWTTEAQTLAMFELDFTYRIRNCMVLANFIWPMVPVLFSFGTE